MCLLGEGVKEIDVDHDIKLDVVNTEKGKKNVRLLKKARVQYRDPQGNDLPPNILTSLCRFRLKQKSGTIDVWWLYDDGGLSMLLPHILTTRSSWANSKLRVFCLASDKEELVNKATR